MVADPAEQPSPWALDDEASKPLPRGRHALSRETVLASQRGRMLHAALVATAVKGFGYVVVADVISEAGVSRKAFYEHFSDFEDCWFQAYETAAEVLFGEMAIAAVGANGAGDPRAGLGAGIAALARNVAQEPQVAHAMIVDIAGGGPRGLNAERATLNRWAKLLLTTWDRSDASKSSDQRKLAALAAVSIVTGVCRDHLVAGTTDSMPAISDQITALMAKVLST